MAFVSVMDQTSTSPTTSNTVTLLRGSVELLVSCLNQSNWTTKRRELHAAGLLAESLELSVADRPVYSGEVTTSGAPMDQRAFANFRATVKTWEREPLNFSVTDAVYQSAISCLRHFSDEKRLPANIFTSVLLDAFKLSE